MEILGIDVLHVTHVIPQHKLAILCQATQLQYAILAPFVEMMQNAKHQHLLAPNVDFLVALEENVMVFLQEMTPAISWFHVLKHAQGKEDVKGHAIHPQVNAPIVALALQIDVAILCLEPVTLMEHAILTTSITIVAKTQFVQEFQEDVAQAAVAPAKIVLRLPTEDGTC